MAKTKVTKQVDALERLYKRLGTCLPGYNYNYTQSQINILIRKLNDQGHKVGYFCAMCGLGVYGSQDVICPKCRKAFQGVSIQVTKLTEAFETVGNIFQDANSVFDGLVTAMKPNLSIVRNSQYGIRPINPYKG